MSNAATYQSDSFLDECLPGDGLQIMKLKDSILRYNSQIDEVRSILLLGETGVGKTYISKVIAKHRCWLDLSFLLDDQGKRLKGKDLEENRTMILKTQGENILNEAGNPYSELSVPSLEGNLSMSQLFGHKKGAFTGAIEDHPGFLCKKEVKDILLDEIGYASKEMQRNLLQVLQDGSFYRLGSTKERKVHSRILFATNQKLDNLVEKGEFHEDLLWRITDYVLYVPPLRERKLEIIPICNNILYSLNKSIIRDLSGENNLYLKNADLKWAESYSWPGNIRELEKTLKRWFLYRGEISFEESCDEVKPYIPRIKSENPIHIDSIKARQYFSERIQKASIKKIDMLTPSKEVNKLMAKPKIKVESIFADCLIKTGRKKLKELEELFTGATGASIRVWISKKKVNKTED